MFRVKLLRETVTSKCVLLMLELLRGEGAEEDPLGNQFRVDSVSRWGNTNEFPVRKQTTKKSTFIGMGVQSSIKERNGSVVARSELKHILRQESGFQESTAEREKKKVEQVRETFRFLLEENRWGRPMKVMVCLLVFVCISVIIGMMVLLFAKLSNK
jgi:hypothetical protein